MDQDGSQGADADVTRTSVEGFSEDPGIESPLPELEGYRFLRLLGAGGMGSVYLAEDTRLGRRVAIKLVLDRASRDSNASERFLREARTMATVEHPNIVRIYAFGEAGGRPYLVMEYVEGESLAEKLRRDGRLAVSEALKILHQAVEALKAAWAKRIVHRDIKPSNILMTPGGRVRVADFGLAKTLEWGDKTTLTQPGSVLGTPHYCSPEQARGRTLDFRSDIYSLGIVFYEMLTGRRPFEGSTPFEVLEQHMREPLPSLSDCRPEIPARLERLLLWMTAKEPLDRPPSYESLEDALKTLWDPSPSPHLPTTATSAVSTASGRKLPRKRLSRVLGIAAAIVAVFLIFEGFYRERQGLPVVPKNAVVVLPFSGLGDGEEKGAESTFARGMTEDLIMELSKINELNVVSGEGLEAQSKGKSFRELGVAMTLHGSVRRVEDRTRIVARLIEVRSQRVLWGESYVRELSKGSRLGGADLSLQGELARRIARAVGEKVRAWKMERKAVRRDGKWVAAKKAASAAGAEEHLKMAQYQASIDRTREAMAHLRKAVELDPSSLDLLKRLGAAYADEDSGGEKNSPVAGLKDLASPTDVGKLADLAPGARRELLRIVLPALIVLRQTGKSMVPEGWRTVGEDTLREMGENVAGLGRPFGLDREEEDSSFLLSRGLAAVPAPRRELPKPQAPAPLGAKGKRDKHWVGAGGDWYRKTDKLQRQFIGRQLRGILGYLEKRQPEAALDHGLKILEVEPVHLGLLNLLARAYIQMEQPEKAEQLYANAAKKLPSGSLKRAEIELRRAKLLQLANRDQQAAAVVEDAEAVCRQKLRTDESRLDAVVGLARAAAVQGNKAKALELLEEAADGGFEDYRNLRRDPLFEAIHGDPKFQRILQSIEATWKENSH